MKRTKRSDALSFFANAWILFGYQPFVHTIATAAINKYAPPRHATPPQRPEDRGKNALIEKQEKTTKQFIMSTPKTIHKIRSAQIRPGSALTISFATSCTAPNLRDANQNASSSFKPRCCRSTIESWRCDSSSRTFSTDTPGCDAIASRHC